MSEDELFAVASGGIVVGMDDSRSARAALAYALEEGARRDLSVLALTVHRSPSAWAPAVAKVLDEDRLVGEVQKAAQAVVDEVVAEQRQRGVVAPQVRVGLRTGIPDEVLCRVSQESKLLVIGDRGRGELASRLIGSVVLGAVTHAECPVLVVKPS